MSKPDYSRTIADTRRLGETYALRKRVDDLKYRMSIVWNNTQVGLEFKGLGVAINNARELLDEMEAMLAALSELEPKNS